MNPVLPHAKRELTEIYTGIFAQPGQHPIEIDYDYYIRKRAEIIGLFEEVPKYLLLPEILKLLSYTADDRQHLFFNTLWHTGARLSEALTLTPYHFRLQPGDEWVMIKTLKRGRPSKKKKMPQRLVHLHDSSYLQELKRYIKTHKLKKNQLLFPVPARTAQYWLEAMLRRMQEAGEQLSIDEVSCKTFRHSFAVNLVLSGTHIKAIQRYLGHKRMNSTEVYTKVLTTEIRHYIERTRFS